MLESAKYGFINATDLADYMTKKGMPFRSAYKIVGQIVGDAVKSNKTLEEITLKEYKGYSEIFEQDLYQEIKLSTCVEKRISAGGTGVLSVEKQIKNLQEFLGNI
jgi:argininosuccinate lyase